jgi:hypothetical protein
MPTLLKVLLVIGIVVVIGIIAVVAAGYYFYKNHGQELMSSVQREQQEGAAAGKGQPAESCIKPAIERAKKCDGVICQARTQVFLTTCVGSSVDPQAVCAKVPEGILERGRWAGEECVRRGYPNDQACIQLINALAGGCASGFPQPGTRTQ